MEQPQLIKITELESVNESAAAVSDVKKMSQKTVSQKEKSQKSQHDVASVRSSQKVLSKEKHGNQHFVTVDPDVKRLKTVEEGFGSGIHTVERQHDSSQIIGGAEIPQTIQQTSDANEDVDVLLRETGPLIPVDRSGVPQNANIVGQKGQRSTVVSHVYQQNQQQAQVQPQILNATASASGINYLALAQNSPDDLQNKTISQQNSPFHLDGNFGNAFGGRSGPLIYEVNDSAESGGIGPSTGGSKEPHISAHGLPKTPPQNKKMNEVISQTLFSSYQDSDTNSNATLRFSQDDMERLDAAGNMRKKRVKKYNRREVEINAEGGEKRKQVIKRPTNLEVKTLAKQEATGSVAQVYQSLKPVNFGEMGDGPIPITQLIDNTGRNIGDGALEQAQERTRQLKQAVVEATGEKSPLPKLNSPMKKQQPAQKPQIVVEQQFSPPTQMHGGFGKQSPLLQAQPIQGPTPKQPQAGLTVSPMGKKLLEQTQHASGLASPKGGIHLGTNTNVTVNLSDEAGKGGRKSPFSVFGSQAPSPQGALQAPIVQVINKAEQPAGVQRKHQSPRKYNIESLPTHLNKTFSKEKLTKVGSRKALGSKDRRASKSPSPPRTKDGKNPAIITGLQSILPTNANASPQVPDELLQPLNTAESHLPIQITDPYPTMQSHNRQFATIALSPMASGSDLGREGNNMTGMFSQSSEAISQMMQSGMSSKHRRRLLKDAGTATYNSRNETLRSLTTEQKTTARNRVQDVLAGAYQDQQLFQQPIVIRKKPQASPMRQIEPDALSVHSQQMIKKQRSASVGRATIQSEPESHHMNTLEDAAKRNMYGRQPAPLETPPKRIHFAMARRASEPVKKKEPFRPKFEPNTPAQSVHVPGALYYSNGYMPKLSDLRDALRNNNIFHDRYNPHLDGPEIRKNFATAIKRAPNEEPGKIDEEYESQPLLEMLIPVHQAVLDKQKEKTEQEAAYRAGLHTRVQQVKTIDRLIAIKAAKLAKATEAREQELRSVKKRAEKFRARLNPHVNHDTADSIEAFLGGQRDPKQALLFDFLAQKRHEDVVLPQSMFDAPPEQRKRIERFIAEENGKMTAHDNDNQKFDRLKRKVEELVDQGYTFKQPEVKKVTFGEVEEEDEEGEEERTHKPLALMRKMSSFGNISLKTTTTGRHKALDPTIIDNDLERPLLTEVRQRPAPDFAPASDRKPKLLKAVKKAPEVPEKPIEVTRTQEQQHDTTPVQTAGDDLAVVRDSGNSLDRVDRLIETQSIRVSFKDAQELRKSKEQLRQTPAFVQTHHDALRASKEGPLEFTRQEDDLTVNVEEAQKPSAGRTSSASRSLRESKAEDFQKGEVELDSNTLARHEDVRKSRSLREELAGDVRKSRMLRDHSEILQPINKDGFILDEDDDINRDTKDSAFNGVTGGQPFLGRFLSNSNSAADGIGISNMHSDSPKQPFISLTQQMSQQQFTIAPSILTNPPIVKGQAREKLLQEKRVEMLHKPELNKSSCNHCITKAVKHHEKVMEQFSCLSVQSTIAAQTSAAGKSTALNQAASEFLSVSPSEGHDPTIKANFSMSQLHTTQFESQSNLHSQQSVKMEYAKLARLAPQAIRGLLTQCDTAIKIGKHTDREFLKESSKEHAELNSDVKDLNAAITSVLEAQEEVPLWEDLRELQQLEKASDATVIAEMVERKRNFDPEAIIKIIKLDQSLKKDFKPAPFKFSPDIATFLKERFEKSVD